MIHVKYVDIMGKQNLTVSLPQQTIRKAKILAARRGSSISGLLADQIEILVGEDEAYERAQRQAAARNTDQTAFIWAA